MEGLVKGFEVVPLVIIARYSIIVELLVSHSPISFLLVEKSVWDYTLVVDRERPQLLLLFASINSIGIIINDPGGSYVF